MRLLIVRNIRGDALGSLSINIDTTAVGCSPSAKEYFSKQSPFRDRNRQ
jgi:hypothetical protein